MTAQQASLQQIDQLLAESVDQLVAALNQTRDQPQVSDETTEFATVKLGSAIVDILDFRKKLFELEPELKPQRLIELETAGD